jgi:hypothetical protein
VKVAVSVIFRGQFKYWRRTLSVEIPTRTPRTVIVPSKPSPLVKAVVTWKTLRELRAKCWAAQEGLNANSIPGQPPLPFVTPPSQGLEAPSPLLLVCCRHKTLLGRCTLPPVNSFRCLGTFFPLILNFHSQPQLRLSLQQFVGRYNHCPCQPHGRSTIRLLGPHLPDIEVPSKSRTQWEQRKDRLSTSSNSQLSRVRACSTPTPT